MVLKNLGLRKHLGLAVIALSVILLLAQFGIIILPHPLIVAQRPVTMMSISLGGLIVGAYLVAGPLGLVVTMIPAILAGCGGGGGGGPKAEPDPDLGEPPEPPDSFSSRFRFLQ